MENSSIFKPVPTVYGGWLAKYDRLWREQIEKLRTLYGASIEKVFYPGQAPTDVPIIYVAKEKYLDVLEYLKTNEFFNYRFLVDYTATDEGGDPRFVLVVNLCSYKNFSRIRIKLKVKEGEETPTLIPLWKGANWAEREIWDMYGLRFIGHPDLRRVLMDDRWEGHPLRKDYDLKGYQIFPTPMEMRTDLLEG